MGGSSTKEDIMRDPVVFENALVYTKNSVNDIKNVIGGKYTYNKIKKVNNKNNKKKKKMI